MTELFKLSFNNLRNNKKQSIITIVAVILISMFLFLASIVASIYRGTMIKEALYNGDFHAVLINSPYSNIEKLKSNSQIESVKVLEEISSYKIVKEFEDEYIFIRGTDLPLEEYLTISSGRLPENDHEIIVFHSAEYNGVKTGDILNGFTVVGFYFNSKLESHNLLDNPKTYAYTTKEVNRTGENASFIINLKSPNNAYNKISTIANEINSEGIYYNESLLRAYGQYQSNTEQKTHDSFLLIFLSIISIFSGCIIYNAFSISLNERKKLLGILRSIGASRKQLYFLSMFEILIIAIISIPISLILSIGISYLIVLLINSLISGIVSSLSFTIHWPYIIISLLYIIITIIISASKPAITSSKTSPLNLIRNTKSKKIRKVKENYPLIRKIFGEEGVIAYKNRKRNSRKFLGPIVTLTLSLILFISVSAYINYLKLNLETELPNYPDFHIVINNLEEINSNEIIKNIKSMEHIDEYVEYKMQRTNIKVDNNFTSKAKEVIKDDNLSIAIYAIDDDSFKKYQQNLNTDSSIIFYNNHEYYDSDVNKQLHIKLLKDDTNNITLLKTWINKDDTKQYYINNLLVSNDNYLNTFNNSGIVMSLSAFEKNYDMLPTTEYVTDNEERRDFFKNMLNIDLYSKRYKQLNSELSNYLEKYDDEIVYLEPNAVNYKGYILIYNLIFIGLFSVIGFVGLIATLNIFNSISANMNLRSREFSMYRSMGLSHKGLLKVINLESFFLIITPLLNGIPISYIIVRFLMKTSEVHKVEEKIYMPFPTMYVIIAIISLIILVLITMLYNYTKLRKKNIIDSIREEL